MRVFLAVLAAWLLSATLASAQMMGISGGPFSSSGYVGPIDASTVASSAAFSCSSAPSSAAIGANACTLREAKGNTTSTFVYLPNGLFDAASANTFATIDATLSCTSLTTTLTCTGASSTPHVGSTITGVGYTEPCIVTAVGTFTGGAGTLTTNGCGTVSVAVSTTAQYALFVTTFFDNSGGGNCAGQCNATQATAGAQPQWLPFCANGGTTPCLSFITANSTAASTPTLTSSVGNGSMAVIAQRTANFTTAGVILTRNASNFIEFTTSANTVQLSATGTLTTTASDSAFHAIQTSYGAAGTAIVNVDGTSTTGSSTGAAASTSFFRIGATFSGTTFLQGYATDFIWWPTALSSSQLTAVCHNRVAQYAVPGATC